NLCLMSPRPDNVARPDNAGYDYIFLIAIGCIVATLRKRLRPSTSRLRNYVQATGDPAGALVPDRRGGGRVRPGRPTVVRPGALPPAGRGCVPLCLRSARTRRVGPTARADRAPQARACHAAAQRPLRAATQRTHRPVPRPPF